MKLAHVSDLHILSLEGVGAGRFVNKRVSGYANLRFKRNHVHNPEYVRGLFRRLREVKPDHVVITGDLTNLALEAEFRAVRTILEDELGMSSENVSIVPGNHDVYTRGADRARRFLDYFASNVTSDLPVAVDPWGAFPFVRFRGPLALIGLRTAVPRAPMIASGELGTGQIEALRGIFAHPELRKRLPVFLMHHPPINPRSRRSTFTKGLTDADWFCATLQHLREGLVLHGHLHNRVHRRLSTHEGNIDVVGATSASLDHEHMDAMAGFNLYEISNDGYLANTEAWVMQGDSFVRREIPMT